MIDVYPRTSPVNIPAERHKDTGFSLAAIFGFAAANASEAYNREHPQLTNAMSQPSYVTKFGAGLSTFGWLLGKTPGDDAISTGEKEFYALVSILKSCGDSAPVHCERIARKVARQKGRFHIFDQLGSTCACAADPAANDNVASKSRNGRGA
jgi:hypothetical protein